MKRFLILFLVTLWPAVWPSLCEAEAFSGRITVIDGDTLTVGATRVRLFGIDAPELGQTCTKHGGTPWGCGEWTRGQATARLQNRVGRCEMLDVDKYGRTVARCFVRNTDISTMLVENGLAQAYRRYSLDYIAAEKTAVVAGLGIWQGDMQPPHNYRRTIAPPQDCAIKGNISAGGRIFHLPGQEHYAATRISPYKGERWFCSAAEARAAGWRKARR